MAYDQCSESVCYVPYAMLQFSLLQQHHPDGLGVRWRHHAGDVDAGGQLRPGLVSAVPGHPAIGWPHASICQCRHLSAVQIIDDQPDMGALGEIIVQCCHGIEGVRESRADTLTTASRFRNQQEARSPQRPEQLFRCHTAGGCRTSPTS